MLVLIFSRWFTLFVEDIRMLGKTCILFWFVFQYAPIRRHCFEVTTSVNLDTFARKRLYHLGNMFARYTKVTLGIFPFQNSENIYLIRFYVTLLRCQVFFHLSRYTIDESWTLILIKRFTTPLWNRETRSYT